jgi:uncharacterized protein (TIGR00661 family)
MRILYALQGTGNGHVARAKDVISALQKRGNVDVLISGTESDVDLDHEIKYKLRGMSYAIGKNGGIDIWESFKQISLRDVVKQIRGLDLSPYDFVVNDFEPISAWASIAQRVPSLSMSHQSALLSNKAPKPKSYNWLGEQILRFYAPTDHIFGLHFKSYDENIYTPIIRNSIRSAKCSEKGHFTVYLPAYSDKKLIKVLTMIPLIDWQVFSKHTEKNYEVENVSIRKLNNSHFIQSIASSSGVLCSAGFETPAEALYLNKKLMVIPMKKQYEQFYNAAALKDLGVPVLKELDDDAISQIRIWTMKGEKINIKYPNITQSVVDKLILKYISTEGKPATQTSQESLLVRLLGLSQNKTMPLNLE